MQSIAKRSSFYLSRINGKSSPPPQGLEESKKVGGGLTARKSPIGEI